jgi:hypothetical protein
MACSTKENHLAPDAEAGAASLRINETICHDLAVRRHSAGVAGLWPGIPLDNGTLGHEYD